MDLDGFRLANSSQGTRLRRHYVAKYLSSHGSGCVLECGCGVGAYSRILQRIAGSLYSFDINTGLVQIADTYVKGARFFVADIENAHFAGETFDTVVATDVIEHLKSPEEAIKNMYAALKPGGIFILTVPSKSWDIIYKIFGIEKEDIGHYKLYTVEEMNAIFKKEGLVLVGHKKIQSFISAFIDVLAVKLSMAFFGKHKVLHSEMAVEAAKSKLLNILYRFSNIVVYPVIIFLEYVLPQPCKTEYLLVFKKSNA